MKKKSKSLQEIQLQATSLDQEGRGVASYSFQQKPSLIKIPQLLPSEQARVSVENHSQQKQEAYAIVKSRLTKATDRVEPQCAAYGSCGGCVLQHLAYSSQQRWKETWLKQTLEKYHLDSTHLVSPCIPSPNQGYGGRRQAKFVVTQGTKGIILGSYAPRTHQIIDMTGCKLIRPSLEKLAQTIASLLTKCSISSYEEKSQQGLLRYVILRESSLAKIQIIWIVTDRNKASLFQGINAEICQLYPNVQSIVLHENTEPGNALFSSSSSQDTDPQKGDQVLLGFSYLWEKIGPIYIRLSARSFVQANDNIAQKMYTDVAQALSPSPEDHLLDLYCGVGGIGLTLLNQVPDLQLTGIEENPFAIADAQAAILQNSFPPNSTQFLCSDAKQLDLASLSVEKRPISLVTLNPPRKGCDPQVLHRLIELQPRALAYISCYPETLARDLVVFTKQGYQIQRITPYDLHPHSPHIETMVILQKQEK